MSSDGFTDFLEQMRGGGDRHFSSLADVVSEKTLQAITEMGFSEMMEIQHKSVRPLLQGQSVCITPPFTLTQSLTFPSFLSFSLSLLSSDLMGAAQTGSGKTLAFLIPAVELLHKLKFMPRNGR